MPTTATLLHVKVAPKGMGLNDFVAYEEGYYAQEGIDIELGLDQYLKERSFENLIYHAAP